MGIWKVEIFWDKRKVVKHETDHLAANFAQALRIAGAFFENYRVNSLVAVISDPKGQRVVELRDPKVN